MGDPRIMLAVAADGAGSASRSDEGAREACETFLNFADLAAHRAGRSIAFLPDDFGPATVADIRSSLERLAAEAGASLREFACTLLGAIVTDDSALFVQIGDGAIVYRVGDSGGTEWRLALTPQRGEFANETVFVTRDDAPRRLSLARVQGRIEEVALMTDGVEFLAIHAASGRPHRPFLDHVFRGLRAETGPGYSGTHSDWIEAFLSSAPVCSRTDDDKTLILCCRAGA
jgi:hypothetical protein